MDVVLLKDIVLSIAAILAAVLSIWNFVQSPAKKNATDITAARTELQAEIKTIDDRTDELGGRVSTIETILRTMPDKDSMHRLEVAMERMTGEVATLAATMNGELTTLNAKLQPVEAISKRLQEFMIEDRKNGTR